MVIGLDIDDVVANLIPVWIDRYNQVYRDTVDWRTLNGWDLRPFIKPECGDKIYDLLGDDLYDEVEPVIGAAESIAELRAAGHRVVFITAGMPKGPGGDRKLRWLRDWSFLPDDTQPSPDYMVCYDKGLLNADILVDDKPENCRAFAATGGYSILFSQPHNARYTPGPRQVRALTWYDVLRLILGDNEPKSPRQWVNVADSTTAKFVGEDVPLAGNPGWTAEDEAISQYVLGGHIRLDGFEYEPWTAYWTMLPVAGELTQHAGDVYRYYATHWWKRIDREDFMAGSHTLPPQGPSALAPTLATVSITLDSPGTPHGHETPADLATGGVKYDGGKSRFDLLPPYPLMELARLFTIGTHKYDDRNWEKGMPFGKVFSAMQRHAWKWWAGDELDEETGVSHLTSVAWCAFVLLEYTATRQNFDDRPVTDPEHINDTLIAAEVLD